MSKSNTRSFIIHLFVFVVSLALVGTDLVVSAQNTNSGTTMQNDNMSAQNSNMSGTSANRRGRGRRRGNANTGMANANTTGDMQGNANTGVATSNANMTGKTSMGGRRRRRSGGSRRIVGFPAGQTSTDMQNAELERTTGKPEDFTGQSYTGTINYPGGSLSGPAKLEFMADNQFSLTPEGGQAMMGRYTAVTTRGYTGVTMMFGTASGPTTPATIISVRLKKVGNGVQIMNVPEESKQFSFSSSGKTAGGMSGKVRRPRRGKRAGKSGKSKATGNACNPMAHPVAR
jgi:hypothetical protein